MGDARRAENYPQIWRDLNANLARRRDIFDDLSSRVHAGRKGSETKGKSISPNLRMNPLDHRSAIELSKA